MTEQKGYTGRIPLFMQPHVLRGAIYASLIWLTLTFNCSAALHLEGARFYLNEDRVTMASYSPDLAKFLRDADVIAIDNSPRIKDSVLLVVRRSTAKLGLSLCGAGHEDRLALIVYSSKKLRLVDSIPLQSCENNVTLVLPDLSIPDNPANAIKLDSDNLEFSTMDAEMTGSEVHRFLITTSGFKKAPSPSSDGR